MLIKSFLKEMLDTKEVTQLQKFKKEEFYESNPDMSWYYSPIKNKEEFGVIRIQIKALQA